MIRLLFPSNQMIAGTLVASALRRSCGEGSVESVTFAFFLEWLENPDVSCWFFISPPDDWSDAIKHALCNFNTKFILFGSIPPKLGKFLGVKWQRPISDELKKASDQNFSILACISSVFANGSGMILSVGGDVLMSI